VRKAASQESTSQDLERDERPRDSHGRRGLQPPPLFDFDQLGNGTFLSEFETAAVLRVSSNTLAAWRGQPAHPLRWLRLPNGFIRYRVAAIRAYVAMGAQRKSRRKDGSPPATDETAASSRKPRGRKPERARGRRAGNQPETAAELAEPPR